MLSKVGSFLGAVGLLSSSMMPASGNREFHDATTTAFLKETLHAVNTVRIRHHSAPVRLDDDLTRYAKSRVRSVSKGHRLSKGHRGLRTRTGEVLYWGSGASKHSGATDARYAVAQWYSEGAHYNFDSPGFSPWTGHFTQLVWKKSRRIGAARAVGGRPGHYETYIAVEFENPGNIAGKFRQNVFPPSGHSHWPFHH